ncbi:MAG TPA: phosphomannose isomerase type II C-terminal cupin domain [Candidatus Bathyarchaeia archaeon]|nr:phosphomannose isomerase type II C-terminal cupin domain [Candidatus Bathyarchaeia archaeon]
MDIYSEDRPWGSFEKFHENQTCTVKLIHVNANCRLSLQYHRERWEFWKIVKGLAEVQLDEKLLILKESDSIVIPLGAKHRVKALEEKCIILEISYGRFNEADIVRLEDDYLRTSDLSHN